VLNKADRLAVGHPLAFAIRCRGAVRQRRCLGECAHG
jgi:hypothetical protein